MKTILQALILFIGLSTPQLTYSQDWQWAHSLPGESIGSVETDASGNIYVTGSFSGEASFGSHTLVSNGGSNLYVVKYNPAMEVEWAKSFGGPDTDPSPYDMAINQTIGDISITGTFKGTWQIGANSYSSSGDTDIFIITLDAQGNLKWVRKAGGPGFERSYSITMDRAGNVFITGSINNFGEVRFDELLVTGISYIDMFLAKYDTNGQIQWVKNAGAPPITNYFNQTSGSDVAVDSHGNAYVTGTHIGSTLFGPFELPAGNRMYGYIAKYSADGIIQWVKQVGTTPATTGYSESNVESIAIDSADNIVLTGGYNYGAQFDHISLLSPTSESATYISKLDHNGNAVWARKAEGTGHHRNSSKVRAVRNGSYLVAGQFQGKTSFDNVSITGKGYHDIFVANYTPDGTLLWVKGAGGSGDEKLGNIAQTPSGDIYIVGSAEESAEFYPTIIKPGSFIANLEKDGACSIIVPELASELTLCSGESAEIGTAAQNGYTYEWYPSTGLSNPKISNPTLTLTNPYETIRNYTYILTATGPNGCTASDQIKVTVSPKPIANAGPDKEVCAGANVYIGEQPTKGVSYSWTVTPSLSTFTNHSGSNAIISIPAVATDTEYVFKVRATFGSCFTEDEVKVIAKSNVNAPTTRSGSRCGAGSVNLYVTGKPDGGHYNWYNEDGTFITQSTSDNFQTPELITSKFYFVSAVTAQGCKSGLSSVQAVINHIPPAPKVSAVITYCQGENATMLTAEGKGLNWYQSATTASAYTSVPTPVTSAVGSTDYYVSQTVSGCESPRAKITVNVTAPPTASITTTGPTTFCEGGSVTLSANTGPNYTYQWLVDGIVIENAVSNLYTSNKTGSYSVRVISNDCSQTSPQTAINVTSTISNNLVSGSQTICAGQAAAKIGGSMPTGGNGNYSYHWESSTTSSSSGFAPAPGLNSAQLYTPNNLTQNTWFRRKVSSEGCSSTSESVKITVAAVSTTPGAIQGSTNLCAGQSTIVYSVSSVSGASSYTWTVPTGFTIVSGQGTDSITINAGSSSGILSIVANNECGASPAKSIAISVTSLPAINAGAKQSFCVEEASVTLTGFSPAGGSWSGPGVSETGVFNPTDAGVGNHTLTYRITQGDCTATATKKITVTSPPTVTLAAAFGDICSTTTDLILAGGQPSGGTYSGPGVNDGVFNAVTAGNGTHIITYTYTSNGCTSTASQNITVSTCTGIEKDNVATGIIIYPNPTSSSVHVEATLLGNSDAIIRVYDIAGKLTLERIFKNHSGELSQTLSLQGFSKGLYLLSITTDNGTVYRKILFE